MTQDLFKEKVYNVLQKTSELEESNPGISDLMNEFLDLFMSFAEFQNTSHLLHQANIDDINGRLNNASTNGQMNVDPCCENGQCGTKQTQQQGFQVSEDIENLAEDMFGNIGNDNNGYQQYINNKRKETADFVSEHNDVEDEESLEENIAVLSDFIDKKLG